MVNTWYIARVHEPRIKRGPARYNRPQPRRRRVSMPVRRKVFRIEEMRLAAPARVNAFAAKSAPVQADALGALASGNTGIEGLRQLKDETDSIFRAINRTKQEIAALHESGLSGAQSGRVRQELDAVMGGAEHASQ